MLYLSSLFFMTTLTAAVDAIKQTPIQQATTPISKTAEQKPAKKVITQNLFSLPNLMYAYDALEPYIDAKTMEIHYTKHHQAYVDNLNKAFKEAPEYSKHSLEYLLTHLNELPESIRIAVRDNAGGHWNHSMFWQCMTPPTKSKFNKNSKLAKAITTTFGSFDTFKELFTQAARTRFGSGWAWLCVNKENKLKIMSSKDQDCPLSYGFTPVLCLDIWEHAYYLKYQNKRADYITAWWNVVNWSYAESLYTKAIPAKN